MTEKKNIWDNILGCSTVDTFISILNNIKFLISCYTIGVVILLVVVVILLTINIYQFNYILKLLPQHID